MYYATYLYATDVPPASLGQADMVTRLGCNMEQINMSDASLAIVPLIDRKFKLRLYYQGFGVPSTNEVNYTLSLVGIYVNP